MKWSFGTMVCGCLWEFELDSTRFISKEVECLKDSLKFFILEVALDQKWANARGETNGSN